MKKRIIGITASVLTLICITVFLCISFNSNAAVTKTYIDKTAEVEEMLETATSYVLVRHKQLGASHYAYTEGLSDSDTMETESSFEPGSKLCLVTLEDEGDKVLVSEETLINSASGVIRDPDVSEDGERVVFSWKKNNTDDFHLYEYSFETKKSTQLTFGSGCADIEPVYAANGTIVFNSTRDVQTVDCWYTPVSNLYYCNADGSNITRVGYDQVHTTYPTTTSDGRILYTRWDYNDRNQMYVQALFQMFPDGTIQTEVFGNDVNNPSTLLHTREIPGNSYKYVTIISGHHMYQVGKIAVIDTSVGRNTVDAVDYVFEDSATRQLANNTTQNVDNSLFQEGTVFKYPYAFREGLYLTAMSTTYSSTDNKRNANFDIVLMDERGKTQTVVKSQNGFPASQMVPVKTTEIFNRASIVNYKSETATYYVANVYLGEGMKGVAAGSAKYLRVVALEFRTYAVGATVASGTGGADPYSPVSTGNGAWDVKQVLGIIPICNDGSAMFTVPANTPLYFQVLDKNGDLIQTMRSWSTLQPGEYFSCVGCHLDKNIAPPTSLTITEAMKAGVQTLQPDTWMSEVDEYGDYDPYKDEYIGFDYLKVVQPILNANCTSCHSNTNTAYSFIKVDDFDENKGAVERATSDTIFATDSKWEYTKTAPAADWYTKNYDSSSWSSGFAPFGQVTTAPKGVNTVWKDSDSIWLRKTVTVNQYDAEAASLQLYLAYSKSAVIYINGIEVYNSDTAKTSYTTVTLESAVRNAVVIGKNVFAVKVNGDNSARFFALEFKGVSSNGNKTVVSSENLIDKGATWKYYTDKTDSLGSSGDWTAVSFNDSSWDSHAAPLGNRLVAENDTTWTGENVFLWARYEFNLDSIADVSSMILKMNVFFDDDVYFYLNGHLVYSNERYVDDYTDYQLDGKAQYLQAGKNVFAICVRQHSGGYEFDLSLKVDVMSGSVLSSDAPVSLEATPVYGYRMRKYFPLSYLVLTGSTVSTDGGNNTNVDDDEWIGDSTNRYTTYISSMSQCEILRPYYGGSTKSAIIKKLRAGHGNLTEKQIAAISCWIDLAVPCYGTYDPEGMTNWSDNAERKAAEETNKSQVYDILDKYSKLSRAGMTPEGEITLKYGNNAAVTGTGLVTYYTTSVMRASTVITVTLPKGEKYLGFSLCTRLGESIIYCPDGTFTYKVPTGAASVMPSKVLGFVNNMITARVVTEEELAKVHNLALNAYDLADSKNAYPHVTATNVAGSNVQFLGRNAIDGFVSNKEAGTYPHQAWVAKNLTADDSFTIDYGREVTLDEIMMKIRSSAADTYFTSCTVQFSNGSSITLDLRNTSDDQTFEIDPVKTTYVKFTAFEVNDSSKYASITEIRTFGTEAVG